MESEASTIGPKVVATIDPETEPGLRSVVSYTPDSYTINYIRSDVRDQYSSEQIETAIDELRLATMQRDHLNSVFKDVHGEFYSDITAFEDAIEFNFVITDGRGVEVAFDRDTFPNQRSVIDEIQTVITDTQTRE